MEYIPPDIPSLCSPFMGGGSIELACTARGIEVFAYDAFKPLVVFWQELLKDAPALAAAVNKYHPLSSADFYALQRRYQKFRNRRNMAAVFYTLNRSSFSGATLSGGMSIDHPRFTPSAIERLANFKVDKLRVELADFAESMAQHKRDFLYLDPPYANRGRLYGNRGDMHVNFDHEKLAGLLKQRRGWLLSYNDCETVRRLYEGFRIITPDWKYGMSARKTSNEILIFSRD